MNRPHIANVAVSSSTLQQGLFLLLAVLMTLLACTAYQHLNAKPEPLLYPTHQASTRKAACSPGWSGSGGRCGGWNT